MIISVWLLLVLIHTNTVVNLSLFLYIYRWENTTTDALHALNYINTRVEIDQTKIAILGHSIGGTTALNLLLHNTTSSPPTTGSKQQPNDISPSGQHPLDDSIGSERNSSTSVPVLSTIVISAAIRSDLPFVIEQPGKQKTQL